MRKWGKDSRITMHTDSSTPPYRTIDARPAGEGKPPALELFRLGILSGVAFFLAALLITTAAGERLADALRLALKVGGISMGVVWPLLIFIYVSDDVSRTLNAIMAARLRKKEIDAMVRVRLAEIEMQRAVSLANVQIETERREVATAALLTANRTPRALLLRTPAEEKLINAVMEAYRLANPTTGYLPNHKANPFGRRALGAEYAEITDWLQDPGRRHGVMGAPPVAVYDEGRRAWRLNLERYPTPHDALRALTGRSGLTQQSRDMVVVGGGEITTPPGDGGGENGREVIDWQ